MEQSVLYVGKSAGAIVTGQTIATALWKGWDDPSVVPDLDTTNPEVGRRSLISCVWQERQTLWFKAKRTGGLHCRLVGGAQATPRSEKPLHSPSQLGLGVRTSGAAGDWAATLLRVSTLRIAVARAGAAAARRPAERLGVPQ
jgi:hypothetical protein